MKSGQQKLLLQNSHLAVFIGFLVFVGVVFYLGRSVVQKDPAKNTVSPTPLATPTPTPRPLTFTEMNTLYGPCVQLPVLMYHHIQTKEAAADNKQAALTVSTDFFRAHMQYLKDRNYNIASMADLVNFFDSGTAIPKHSVLLTFDDGYQDFYTDAFPVLQGFGFEATVFTSTGLINNPGYLTWDEILSMNGVILFANHTWSHKNVGVADSIMQYEISVADTQLSERGLNTPKVFAYPYGLDSIQAEKYLESLGYKMSFSTKPGNILCKGKRFDLPRVRVGGSPLSSYGF